MTTSFPCRPEPAPAYADDVGRLFESTAVAGMRLQSSIAMAPMTRSRSPRGVPTKEVAEYYRRRAEGGVGLVITEGVLVGHPSAGHEESVPRMTSGDAEAGWRVVVDAVHDAGGRIAAQLWHLGSLREESDGMLAWSPSGVRETGVRSGRAMTLSDIDDIIRAFAESAAVAFRSGFDAVEVHGAHGYLIDEFLWSATNRRTDAYGGSVAARSRFAAEIVAAVRANTTPDFPIIVRFSQFKERELTARLADTPAGLADVLGPLVEAGASMLHASTRRFWEPEFEGSPLNLAGWSKKLTGLPTLTVGSVGLTHDFVEPRPGSHNTLEALARRHSRGEFDLVAVGRALLANPCWPRLAATRRASEIVDFAKEHESVFR